MATAMPPTIVAVSRATCVLPAPVRTTNKSLPPQRRSNIIFSVAATWWGLGSGIPHIIDDARQTTSAKGVSLSSMAKGGKGDDVVVHVRVAVVLVGERKDGVLERQTGA